MHTHGTLPRTTEQTPKEVAKFRDTAEARFLVARAHAMAVHGVVHGTQDLDLWIDPTKGNASKVWEALTGFWGPRRCMGRA